MERFTKAGMLKYLKKHMPSIGVLPILTVRSSIFFGDETGSIRSILEFAQGHSLAVRSSSVMEDQSDYSNAGRFESILNVRPEYEEVQQAVKRVYESYGTDCDEEILIQPMLQNICKSGVVFTADMDTFADYYIVNYSESGSTVSVTDGSSNELRTLVRYKYYDFPLEDKDLGHLLEICRQIEAFLGIEALDLEFAADRDGNVFILQVRPIAKGDKLLSKKADIGAALTRIYKKIKKLSMKHPFLLGDTTCFGVMPDWNPAEILGVRPKKLSISLYKELITDHIWAYQRLDYGYRDLSMHPLMISFCGVPYIDTRITFNSFVPKNLNAKIAEKLINYYLEKLARYPAYHDKIEFEIVFLVIIWDCMKN